MNATPKRRGRPSIHGEPCGLSGAFYLPLRLINQIRERGGSRYIRDLLEQDANEGQSEAAPK